MRDISADNIKPDLERLMSVLTNRDEAKNERETLLLVSFERLPINGKLGSLVEAVDSQLSIFKKKQNAAIYQIGPCEFAIGIHLNERNELQAITDLKTRAMGVIQEFFPEHFQDVDQSKLVRKVPISLHRKKLIELVSQRLKTESSTTTKEKAPKQKLRQLNSSDISILRNAAKTADAAFVAKHFIRRQKIFQIDQGSQKIPVGEEYFIAVKEIQKRFLPGVEFNGRTTLFDHMTTIFDEMLLGALEFVADRSLPISINLNIQSLFTPAFNSFTKKLGKKSLDGIKIEFQLTDIILNHNHYHLVRQLMQDFQGTPVVDTVYLDTVGLIRMDRLKPGAVKLFWQSGDVTDTEQLQSDIDKIKSLGIVPILARVDHQDGLTFGQQLGINQFQGFYFDKG